jgi:hypothetical protein
VKKEHFHPKVKHKQRSDQSEVTARVRQEIEKAGRGPIIMALISHRMGSDSMLNEKGNH